MEQQASTGRQRSGVSLPWSAASGRLQWVSGNSGFVAG